MVLGTRLSAQQSPIKDFISNYYEQLNNLGDVSLSMAERRLFRAEILNSYFMFDGSLVWNDLRPRGSEYVKPAEYLDNIVTDFPKGVTFNFTDLQISPLEAEGANLKGVIRLKSFVRPQGGSPVMQELQFVVLITEFSANTLSARIKSVDRGSQTPIRLPAVIAMLEKNMLYVAGGSYRMGCTAEQQGSCENDEKPVHEVTLSGFYINKYEVTQAEWRAVMGNSPSYFGNCDQCPVESVNWSDVQEFIWKLNSQTGKSYRLPTEAEWEYAARGGKSSQGYKYSGSDNLEEIGVYDSGSERKTYVVGQQRANELGLYDMSGNVWEWCSDWYGAYGSERVVNPGGPPSGSSRVHRGGLDDDLRVSRVSYRLGDDPTHRHSYLGFRLARSSQ